MNIEYKVFLNIPEIDSEKASEFMETLNDAVVSAGYGNVDIEKPLNSVLVVKPFDASEEESMSGWLAKLSSGAFQVVLPSDSEEFIEGVNQSRELDG